MDGLKNSQTCKAFKKEEFGDCGKTKEPTNFSEKNKGETVYCVVPERRDNKIIIYLPSKASMTSKNYAKITSGLHTKRFSNSKCSNNYLALIAYNSQELKFLRKIVTRDKKFLLNTELNYK